MSPALLWFLLAAALIVGEILTPTFFLAALAVAALAAATAGWLGAELWVQVLTFAIGSGISAGLARPLAERFLHSGVRSLPTNAAALIGAEARVTETIDPDRMGRVKVRGDDWRAVSEDGEPIAAGARVIVTEVEGTTLHVVRYP
jgi:membrane protein implicated in regulation of membrane protease activity